MSVNYKLSHLRNLVVLSRADGRELPGEIEFIRSVMERENLTEEDYQYCVDYVDSIENVIPDNYIVKYYKLQILNQHNNASKYDPKHQSNPHPHY